MQPLKVIQTVVQCSSKLNDDMLAPFEHISKELLQQNRDKARQRGGVAGNAPSLFVMV
jgi:hypothetical protein